MTTDPVAELIALIDLAPLIDLELPAPAGGNKWPADLMEKKPGRPPVGVQGRILDAMDDGRITRKEASRMLDLVHDRLRGGGPGLSVVDGDGNLTAISMEGANGTSP
jgi:hypothetical protein